MKIWKIEFRKEQLFSIILAWVLLFVLLVLGALTGMGFILVVLWFAAFVAAPPNLLGLSLPILLFGIIPFLVSKLVFKLSIRDLPGFLVIGMLFFIPWLFSAWDAVIASPMLIIDSSGVSDEQFAESIPFGISLMIWKSLPIFVIMQVILFGIWDRMNFEKMVGLRAR